MNVRDEIRLRDMLDAARTAQEFMEGKDRTHLSSDKMLKFALVRAIEIVGEAASQVSQQTRATLTQIEWKPIIGMRNRVIHDYGSINLTTVWEVVNFDIPKLIAELEKILPPVETDDAPAD
jgi:uncharacterized protein with HEPN domain